DRLSRAYRPPLLHDSESERAASARSALGAPSQYAVGHERSVQTGPRQPPTRLIHATRRRRWHLSQRCHNEPRVKAIRLSTIAVSPHARLLVAGRLLSYPLCC